MSIFNIFEHYLEIPFNVGNSLHYLKQNNTNLRIFSYELDKSVKCINWHY